MSGSRWRVRYLPSHLQRQRKRSPYELPPPASALPCVQQSLPSSNSLMSSLAGLDDALKPLRIDAVRQECVVAGSRNGYVSLGSNNGPYPPQVLQDSIKVTGDLSSYGHGDSSLPEHVTHGTETGIWTVDAEISLSDAGGSEAGTALSQIDPDGLRISQGTSSRLFSHPTYAVQFQDFAGNHRSKAWGIQVYAIQSRTGPKLFVRIYHDPRNPHQFPPLSPPLRQWLRWEVACSRILLERGVTSTLAAALELLSHGFRTRMKQSGLGRRDRQVLDLALNKVGDGDSDGSLKAQPWKSFQTACVNWERSGGWKTQQALEAAQKRSARNATKVHRPETDML